MTLNSLISPPAKRQPLFQALLSQTQAGPQPLHPSMSSSAAMQDQHWQDVLSGPVPTVPEFTPIGQLTCDVMQLAISTNPHIGDLDLQDLA